MKLPVCITLTLVHLVTGDFDFFQVFDILIAGGEGDNSSSLLLPQLLFINASSGSLARPVDPASLPCRSPPLPEPPGAGGDSDGDREPCWHLRWEIGRDDLGWDSLSPDAAPPPIASVHTPGRVRARLGAPATLGCQGETEGQAEGAGYGVEWSSEQGGAEGNGTLARHEEWSGPGAGPPPFLSPLYGDRLSLSLRGAESSLTLRRVESEDFGEYRCSVWVAGHPEGMAWSSVLLEEDKAAEDTQTSAPPFPLPETERGKGTEMEREMERERVMGIGMEGEMEREMERGSETEGGMERGRATETGRGKDGGMETETEGERGTWMEKERGKETEMATERERGRGMERGMETETETEREKETETETEGGKETETGTERGKETETGTERGKETETETERERVTVMGTPPSLPPPPARVTSLNTTGVVRARLGSPATLACAAFAPGAGPAARYRLRWERRGGGGGAGGGGPNLTLASLDPGRAPAALLHPAYRGRVTATAHGPRTELHFRAVRPQDVGEYRCLAAISGQDGDVSSKPILLLTERPKAPAASSETAILWLILHFFVVLFAMVIGIGSCFLTGSKNRIEAENV